jgi:hypothetical protein
MIMFATFRYIENTCFLLILLCLVLPVATAYWAAHRFPALAPHAIRVIVALNLLLAPWQFVLAACLAAKLGVLSRGPHLPFPGYSEAAWLFFWPLMLTPIYLDYSMALFAALYRERKLAA